MLTIRQYTILIATLIALTVLAVFITANTQDTIQRMDGRSYIRTKDGLNKVDSSYDMHLTGMFSSVYSFFNQATFTNNDITAHKFGTRAIIPVSLPKTMGCGDDCTESDFDAMSLNTGIVNYDSEVITYQNGMTRIETEITSNGTILVVETDRTYQSGDSVDFDNSSILCTGKNCEVK